MRRAIVLSCLLLGLAPRARAQPLPLEPPKKDPASLSAVDRKSLEERALALYQKADREYRAQHLAEAEHGFRQAVALFRQLYPAGHSNLATSLNNLACVLQAQGRLSEAEPLFREALATYRGIYRQAQYPAGHFELAIGLKNLALLLQAQGKLSAAEALFREALTMQQTLYPAAKYPAGHRDLASSLNNLALVLHDQGRLSAAEPLFQGALAMFKRLYPEDKCPTGHPDLAQSLINLAGVLRASGRLSAAEPLFRDAVAMCRQLYPQHKFSAGHLRLAQSLNALASVLQDQGRLSAAEPLFRDALAMRQRLYPLDKYPAGHADLATSLNNLAGVLQDQGRLSAAERLFRDALSMRQQLYPEDQYPAGHAHLATSLNNLAGVLRVQGRLSAAEPLYRDTLAMNKRLYPQDKYPAGHAHLANSLNNLAFVLQDQGRLSAAEPLYQGALAMNKRLYPEDKYPAGHPELALSLNNLANILRAGGRLAAAERLLRDALAMRQRLYSQDKYPAGHPRLAITLNSLAAVLQGQGRLADAEALFREGLAMRRRLYPEAKYPAGHPHLGRGMISLAGILHAQGQLAGAEPLLREALGIYRRLAEDYALSRSEGDTLNFLATFGPTLDAYLSVTDRPGVDPAVIYAAAWQAKAAVSRAFERRHLAARAATVSPRARAFWDELSGLRRQRAELLLAPEPQDPETRKARDTQLEAWARRLDKLLAQLHDALPELARTQDLLAKTHADLQKALPARTVFLDFFRYTRVPFDPAKPGKAGDKRTDCYAAFVVMPRALVRVELGPAGPLEKNLTLWRQAIEGGPGEPPADLPRALRQQLWDKLAAHLPPDVRTVYLAPDQRLAFLPFAALPGKEPGTVLLEDYALAVVPHGPFLLDRLTAPSPPPPLPRGGGEGRVRGSGGPAGLLAVGAVAYDQAPAGPTPAEVVAQRGPAAGEGKPLTWKPLPGTKAEMAVIGHLGVAAGVKVHALTGSRASAARLLEELPGCRYAHLATHGFFADPAFRSRIKADEALFLMQGRERVGAGALSPFVLSGIVCAGANLKETPGRGLLTAEALLNADLSSLELAVLSACETGLGEVGGGEGVLGLQRGFHVAGCKNVIASLWKVDDEATAALMQLFYRNLWEKKQAPLEALRQAQLGLYHHPELLAGLARGERAAFEKVELPAKVVKSGGTDPRVSPVRQWAAFTLSGPGH
jgi:CHAT domain-containing protein